MTEKSGISAWHVRNKERDALLQRIEEEMGALAERHGYECYRIFAHLILVTLAGGSVSVSSDVFERDSRDIRDRSFVTFGLIHDRVRAFAETQAEERGVWCTLLEHVAQRVTHAAREAPLASL